MLSDRSKFWTELFFTTVLVLIIFIGEWLGLIAPLTSSLELVTQPALIRMKNWGAAINQPVSLTKKSFSAARRVQELEKDYSSALAMISKLEYIELENQELRRLLETQARPHPVIISSQVVSYGLPSVSVGKDSNVSKGQPVLAAQTLVGLIGEVSTHQSRVNLLDQKTYQPILAETESGIEGIIIGDGKKILFTQIPKDVELVIGERVVTSGQELISPRLLIGQIQEVIDKPAAPTKQAVIKQGVSFYETPILEVQQ